MIMGMEQEYCGRRKAEDKRRRDQLCKEGARHQQIVPSGKVHKLPHQPEDTEHGLTVAIELVEESNNLCQLDHPGVAHHAV